MPGRGVSANACAIRPLRLARPLSRAVSDPGSCLNYEFATNRINTVLGNLKTSLSGCYHAFDFRKYAARYLAAFCYRFNRRFDLRTLHQRLLVAAAATTPQPLHLLRLADVDC